MRLPFSLMVALIVHARDHNLKADFKKGNKQPHMGSEVIWSWIQSCSLETKFSTVQHTGL